MGKDSHSVSSGRAGSGQLEAGRKNEGLRTRHRLMTRGDGEAETRGHCGFRIAKLEIRPRGEVRRTIADFQKKQRKEILLWELLSRFELVEG